MCTLGLVFCMLPILSAPQLFINTVYCQNQEIPEILTMNNNPYVQHAKVFSPFLSKFCKLCFTWSSTSETNQKIDLLDLESGNEFFS